MALLPQKVGSVTLVRALDDDGVCQRFVGILDKPAGTQVSVRQLLQPLAREPEVVKRIRARLGDVKSIRHPALLEVLSAIENDKGLFVVERWEDTVTLADVVTHCRTSHTHLPLNLFLHIAVQACNSLEALHRREGGVTGCPFVLHLDVRPEAIHLTQDGQVLLGRPGLLNGPTFASQTGGYRLKTAYMAPEQTYPDAEPGDDSAASDGLSRNRLTPASDLFSLGAVLYELLVHRPMFSGASPLRTISQVRKAEVTTQLLEVKEVFAGVDRILYRALALNPRHRYQRAFVLREELRGLMAEFSFSNIDSEARAFLEPLFAGQHRATDEMLPARQVERVSETEPTVLQALDVAALRRELAAKQQNSEFPSQFDDDDDEQSSTGRFDPLPSNGPLQEADRVVQYAADKPDEHWTDLHARHPRTPTLAPLTRRPLVDPDEELLPVSAPELTVPPILARDPLTNEVSVPLQPVIQEAETYPLPEEPPTPPQVPLLVGAGIALGTLLVSTCAGLLALGIVYAVMPAPEAPTLDPLDIQPALGHRTLVEQHVEGVRRWRVPQVDDIPVIPPLGELPEDVQAAVDAMDERDFDTALRLAHALGPDQARFADEIIGAANLARYHRTRPANASWLAAAEDAFKRLALSSDPRVKALARSRLDEVAAIRAR